MITVIITQENAAGFSDDLVTLFKCPNCAEGEISYEPSELWKYCPMCGVAIEFAADCKTIYETWDAKL